VGLSVKTFVEFSSAQLIADILVVV